ncbi:MAG: tetratricopeptide repeat protein, partial [Lachnospiraceae bacterium]|nr:tetratricopeptide repeat protein [Lachnospiraceae bacterium]
VLAFWVLFMPTKLNSANKENRDLQLSYSEEISKKNTTITDLESQIGDLERQLEEKSKEENEEKDREKESKDAFQVIRGSIPNTTYETLCAEAAKAINEHKYEDAISMCNVALQIQEGEDAYYNLGRAYLGNQDEENAKAAFTSLKENYPESDYIDEISDYLSE